jgi:hypothetical protein
VNLKSFVLTIGVVVSVAATWTATAPASSGTPTVAPQPFDGSQEVQTVTLGGAAVLPTTRTVPHWWGSTRDPGDGVTYGYNMVGADPTTCAGAACDVTVQVDITPIVLQLDGMTFSGDDVLPAVLASPVFTLNDYGSTPYASTGAWFTGGSRGPGGVLSQGDAGNLLQLEDATMRAQFNRVGASAYHLRLRPNVLPSVTVDVPQGQGTLLESDRGVVFAGVQLPWFAALLQQLEASADPAHLALYLSDDTFLGTAQGSHSCWCVGGFHSAMAAGRYGIGSGHSNGNAPVQTMIWAPYLSPGLQAWPNGGYLWAGQDILALSHEISEWADDPFLDNLVSPWPVVTGSPEFGCSSNLETGDPVINAGFAMGKNTFRQGPNPNGTQSADGYYHPEDEVMLPWFMRLAPNLVSEPTQIPSADVGRYTFMGDLEPFAGFTAPAAVCG